MKLPVALFLIAAFVAPALADDAAPGPPPPVAALLAARAEAAGGAPARALERLSAALPGAGELAAALRLEAAPIAVGLGRDPWPLLAPLFDRHAPAAQRRAAGEAIRDAARRLPLPLAAGLLQRPLPRPVRREARSLVAIRRGDAAAAAAVIAERDDDRAAREAALWLSGRPPSSTDTRLDVAAALLAGGLWREADALLAAQTATTTSEQRARLAFLRGRAAYRLGRLEEAREHYGRSLESAAAGQPRFAAAVQRARTAELLGDLAAARADWDAARQAAPAEVEGWDGGARSRVLLGLVPQATALLAHAPASIRRIAGPRLAALLLARGERDATRPLLAALPPGAAVVRSLEIAAHLDAGDQAAARTLAATLLADRQAGGWRELVLDRLPEAAPPAGDAAPVREPTALAALAARSGAGAARAALTAALAADPDWAPLLAAVPVEPTGWQGPAAELAAAGLWREAAALYPHRFPDATPSETAWSGHALARAGNGPAALAAGERLWDRLGRPPAAVLPDTLLGHVVPSELTAPCGAAVAGTGTPAAWLAAVIRRESRFDPSAQSAAGALGLAQFVPETGRRLGADEDALWDGDSSLVLAARELARAAARFGPRLEVVAAAYNAGDTVTTAWLAWLDDPTDALLFTAALPYRETAGYVVAVIEGRALSRGVDAGAVP